MSFRPGARLFTTGIRAQAFRQPFLRQPFLRRSTQTAAGTEQKGFAKLWNSPVGPKTVHFWAPIMKWALVLAGAADLTRPASSLSLTQNAALTATGAIWTRWCFVIRPQNKFLATVNFFLFLVGSTQCARILLYQRSLKAAGQEAEGEGAKLVKELEEVGDKAKKAVKS
ncbi:UPF0041-domain-containing protein [Lophiostoma macrostomum CBS 122681]|uniref:Mitochondrial pyruvate carrier n=1 Tax=Lophiostoma macrostomum CBS 122681 TaxID=1314788 RepID=A0A6A6TK93_9PLEO|nr:UPF0041-domain-containing protein [Lophiostoma macrostomum CBS 122681]